MPSRRSQNIGLVKGTQLQFHSDAASRFPLPSSGGRSLFDRLAHVAPQMLLTTQYRMDPRLAAFPAATSRMHLERRALEDDR